MIGSDTLVVKENSKYVVHICSITMAIYFLKKENKSAYQALIEILPGWGEPNAELKQEEVDALLTASHCISPEKPGYHKFVGDGIFLLDLDSKKLYGRDRENKKWKESP